MLFKEQTLIAENEYPRPFRSNLQGLAKLFPLDEAMHVFDYRGSVVAK